MKNLSTLALLHSDCSPDGRPAWRAVAACILFVLASLAEGCSRPPARPAPARPATPPKSAAVEGLATPQPPAVEEAARKQESEAPATERLVRETWDAIFIGGKKVGYTQTTVSEVQDEGQTRHRIDAISRLSVIRFDDQVDQDLKFTSIESPTGEVHRFETSMTSGTDPMVTRGHIAGDLALLETETKGKTVKSELPWQPEFGGFFAMEQELVRNPMKPGEVRTFHALVPVVNQVATVNFIAIDYETTGVMGVDLELLRIGMTVELPGFTIPGVIWTDKEGETLKNVSELMKQETYRTTKEIALDQLEAAELDLGVSALVAVDHPIENAHETRQVRYRVRLDGGDPAAVFPHGSSQEVKGVDGESADITVRALRPDSMHTADSDPPVDDDRKPNNLVQSDDPRVMEMAAEAAGEQSDPWQTALALEKYVRSSITSKNFSTGFATAAEVAQSREGDCTEHAVLLAALARARGIPARVAIGLVYVEGADRFGYHMWNEVYITDRWIAVDGTLAKGGIGAAHLKLGHSNLQGASAYSSFLPVAQVLGRLKIEVLEVE